MKEKQWFQCQECGYTHQEDDAFNIEDQLFVQKYCPKCRDGTTHLWVGENSEDKYLYGNIILDKRYYEYKTK